MAREVKIFTLSSLAKVFPTEEIYLLESENSMLRNETFAFQVAINSNERILGARLDLTSDISEFCSIREVALSPAILTSLATDDFIIDKRATLYPDLLNEINTCDISIRHNMWTCFWITIVEPPIGTHNIKIELVADNERSETNYTIEVIDKTLKRGELKYSNWLHYDCISNYYGLEVFSDSYYDMLGKFLDNAHNHGVNVLYTPLFTPPLDTVIGGERKTVQLISVKVANGHYTFNLDKLKKFVDFARLHGYEKFEFSHLTSQWGALSAPKIVGEDGKQIFGWETSSCGEEYFAFLQEFLPCLDDFIIQNNLESKCYYHISDEPSDECIERYEKISEHVKKYLKHASSIDALSSFAFYEKKLVDVPVVATSHINPFLQNGKNFWAYYCCGQCTDYLSNRFFNFPPQRNRILGMQLYLNNVEGFLQWGYNFYNSYLSKKAINPYITTDGDGSYQAGDCFIVYPGENGVLDSTRHEVFYDGLQDYAALKLLEEAKGRTFVTDLLHEFGICDNFTSYNHSAENLINLRKKINSLLK